MINPFKIICNPVYATIGAAVFTIVQVIGHIFSLAYITWWRDCNVENYQSVYLRFLIGDRDCRELELEDGPVRAMRTTDNLAITTQLDDIILAYFTLDVIWLITAVGLLMGACCRLTGVWALIFYLPWAVINGIVLLFDAFCTTFFALNLPNYGSFLDWLNIIGFTSAINSHNDNEESTIPNIVVGIASILMAFISARGIVIWVINLLLLVVIVKIALKEFKIKQHPTERNYQRRDRNIPRRTDSERIRNWHTYYNAEGNNTESNRQRDALSEVNGVKEPVRVKMTGTLTIISYQTVDISNSNNEDSHSDTEASASGVKSAISTSFNENFATITITDIKGVTPTPSDNESDQVGWSCDDEDARSVQLDEIEVNQEDQCRKINIRNIEMASSKVIDIVEPEDNVSKV